nr:MAG TPA: hypothetical protein [Caudoviricetes sp.]
MRPKEGGQHPASELPASGVSVSRALVNEVGVVSSLRLLTHRRRSIDIEETYRHRHTSASSSSWHTPTKASDEVASRYVPISIRLLVQRWQGRANIQLVHLRSTEEWFTKTLGAWSFLEPADKGLDLGKSVERNYIWHTLFVYKASCDLHRSIKHRLEQYDAIECAIEAKPPRGR